MKKSLIVITVCGSLAAAGWAITPVLKKHDDNFPDAFNDIVLHERIKTFATAGYAPKPGDGEGQFVLPAWVPKDATDVKVKVQTTGNAELIRFTLAETRLELSDGAAACPKWAFTDGPELVADWWPQDVGDGAGRPACSDQYQFRVETKGDQVYAWSNGDLTKS